MKTQQYLRDYTETMTDIYMNDEYMNVINYHQDYLPIPPTPAKKNQFPNWSIFCSVFHPAMLLLTSLSASLSGNTSPVAKESEREIVMGEREIETGETDVDRGERD